jgi:glycosyltransferase involved in cell wall biosynthesis
VTESAGRPPEVSVLIPVRDGGAVLTDQLIALQGQTYHGEWEVVVVDNGSTDGTAALLADWSTQMPQLRVVATPGPGNASRSRNLAADNARGSLLAFCDADDVVDSGWLAALVSAAGHADLIAGRLDVDLLNDEVSRHWRSFAMPAAGGAPAFGYLPYAVSANMAVRSAAFRAVGGFEPEIPGPGSEEIDFCWRVQQAGFRFAYEPAAVVAYRFRTGLRPFMRQQFRYGRGEAALYSRHRGHMQRGTVRDLLRATWYAVSRSQHVGRGRARRGRYLGYVSYRLGRLAGAARFRVAYW